MLKQRTIKKIVNTIGVGLHSGTKVELTLRPAEVDAGIVFRRVDFEPPVEFPASALGVGDTRMASTLTHEKAKISTVEHVMSACAGLGIDNLYIDVSAEEIPIMDGSASSFVYLLQQAGKEEQTAAKKFIRILKSVEVREGTGPTEKWARLDPYHGFKLKFFIEFNHPAVRQWQAMLQDDEMLRWERPREDTEVNADQLRRLLPQIGREAREKAFKAGRSVMVLKEGKPIWIDPDGTERPADPSSTLTSDGKNG